MMQFRRQRYLRIALTALIASVPAAAYAQAQPVADTVFVNGAIYTVDAARTWASAVAVRDGAIVFVGSDAGARALTGSRTRVIDLRGRMLLPGFQDSHAHPSLVPDQSTHVNLNRLRTVAELRSKIAAFAAAHPASRWVVGDGWDEAAFLPSGRPNRGLLDDIVATRPVFLTNNSQHQAWVNSAALEAAHITAATPDPVNGTIVRDGHGEPTGNLQEAAMALVRAAIPPPSADERREALHAAVRKLNELGITAIEDALVRPDDIAAYRDLERHGELTVRAHLCQYFEPDYTDDEAQIRAFVAIRASLHGRDLQADCVKIVLDGAYGSHTVALLEPYSDDANYGTGRLFVEPERLTRLVVRLDALGFQVHIHAIGDRTVRTALNAIGAARAANGYRGTRPTLAHLSLIDPVDLPRFRTLGVIANMTPLWSRGDPWETVFAQRMFGAERAATIYRTRTLLEQGAILVWGSDWPVTGAAPMDGLETAVTHRYLGGRDPDGVEDAVWNPDERLSLEQAIVGYTAAGAYMAHDEQRRGTIEVGKRADLVVLGRNLFDTPVLGIHDVTIDLVLLDGRVVYAHSQSVSR